MLAKKKFMFPGSNLNTEKIEEEKTSDTKGDNSESNKPSASSTNGNISDQASGSIADSSGEKKLSKLEELKRKKEQAMNRIESKIKTTDSNAGEVEKPPAKEEKLSAAELARRKREEQLKAKSNATATVSTTAPALNSDSNVVRTELPLPSQNSNSNVPSDLDATQRKLAELKMKYKNDNNEGDSNQGAKVFPKTTTNLGNAQKKFMFPIKEEEKQTRGSILLNFENKMNEKPQQETVEKVGMDEFSKRLEALQSNLATKLGVLKRESIKVAPPLNLPMFEPKADNDIIDTKNFKLNLKKKLLIDPEAEENKNSIRPHTLVTPSGKKINAKLAAIVAKLEETMGGEKWDPSTGKVINNEERKSSLNRMSIIAGSSWTFEHLTLDRPSAPSKNVKEKKKVFANEV